MQVAQRKEQWQVSWNTISYRWLKLLGAVLLLAATFVLYLIFGARVLAFIDGVHIGNEPPKVQQKPASLEIDELEGEVRILRAHSQAWTDAEEGAPIRSGDLLQTSSESAAVLSITGTIRVEIAPDSVVILEGAASALEVSKPKFRVTSGKLEFVTEAIRRGDEPQFLLADTSIALAESTAGQIWASSQEGTYSIVLLHGSGLLERNDEGFRLQPFERATLVAEEEDLQLTKELPPPFLLVPPRGTHIMSGDCAVPVEFAWDVLPGASGYLFQIASDRFFTRPLLRETVTSAVINLQLPEGNYFWQVESLKAARVSLASPAGQFRHSCGQKLTSASEAVASP